MAEQREVNVILNVKTGKADKNIKGVEKDLKKTEVQAQKTGNSLKEAFAGIGGPIGNLVSRVKSLGTSFKAIAVSGGVAAIGGLGALFVSATKRGAEFAKALSGLEAVSGASNIEMQKLANSAKQLGASTQFTSKEVVGLQTEFAKLGFTTSEILNATESTLDLAASLDVGLGEAASIAGSTLRAFGLETEETQRVVDVMAKSTASTALDFDSLRESLKLVAPTSRAMNVDIEETTALLGILADNGLKGSIAGTGLSKTFIELNKKGIPLNEALEQVANSSNQLNTAIDLVGVVGSKSLLTLANQAPRINELTESFERSAGAAGELAETRLDNLAGDTTKLSSAWEGFLLSIEDGTGIFNTIARGIVQATTALLNFITPTQLLSDELKAQRLELFKTEAEINRLDDIIKDTTTSEEDLKDAQSKRKDVIVELKKQYPDYLKDIDAETVSTEDLKKAIDQVNEALINKILIQEREEEIAEQAEEAAEALEKKLEKEAELTEYVAQLRQKYNDLEIDIQETDPVKFREELLKLQKQELDNFQEGNDLLLKTSKQRGEIGKEIERLLNKIKSNTAAEEEYSEELEKTNGLTAEKEALMKKLGVTTEETTKTTEDGNDASGEEVEVITDLIELKKKELEEAEKMPGTTKREVAARNDKINAINAEIKALRELTLIKDKEETKAQEAIPRMEIRGAKRIEVENTVTANLEEQTAVRVRNLDAEYEADEQMNQLKFQAAFTTLNAISTLNDAFAGKSEKAQKKAFKINKAVGIAQTLIQTFQSAQGAYLSQLSIPTPDAPVRAAIAAGIATTAGLANVAAIAAQKFESPSKETPSTGGGGGLGGVTDSQAPQFNVVGQSGFNQIAQALGQQQPVQAYVVAQDVTTAQQLNNNIISAATVGG